MMEAYRMETEHRGTRIGIDVGGSAVKLGAAAEVLPLDRIATRLLEKSAA